MFGRRYSLLIGKAYGLQESFVPDVPNISALRLAGYRYGGTLEGAPLLEQGNFSDKYLPTVSKEAVYKRRTPEEFQQIQSAILAGFAEEVDRYVNMYYTDPAIFEESAGFLQFENVEITDHHIEFDIEKVGGNSSDGNTGEITIYNLSQETAEFITSLGSTQNFAQLSAGYDDDELRIIIRGNVKVVEDNADGVERRTKIIIDDGGNFVQNQMSVRTYRKGTQVKKIINDILEDVSLPKGYIQTPDESLVIKKPLIVHGRSIEQLKRVLDVFGYSVNIQDLYINIYKRAVEEEILQSIEEAAGEVVQPDVDATISMRIQEPAGFIMDVRLISENSGMTSIPTNISDSSGLSIQEVANEPTSGIKFKHLLSGDLTPNTFVRLETASFSGNYRIIKSTHSGSYEGDRWETEVEAEQVVWRAKESPIKEDPNESEDRPLLEIPERLSQSEDEIARRQRLEELGLLRDD